jgi:hypothetical protein
MATTEKIEQACIDAKDKLMALGIGEQTVSEIEWCLGSFASDGNASGLYQKAEEALELLKDYKKDNPRKVSKKLIEDIQKALKTQ